MCSLAQGTRSVKDYTPEFPQSPYNKDFSVPPGPAEKMSGEKGHGLTIVVTPTLVRAAEDFARVLVSKHDGRRKPEQETGRNFVCDKYGVLGMIGLTNYLEMAGFNPLGYTILDDRPVTEPDFNLFGASFDVKAVPPTQPFVTVNEQARLNPKKRCDFFWPVAFMGSNALRVLRPVKWDVVASWSLRYGHSAYRSCPVDCLAAFENFAEMRQWLRDLQEGDAK